MHPTHNTLSENVRTRSVELLNLHLAAAIDLQGQVKQAHWNVRGPGFIGIHRLFDAVAAKVGEYADMIAERVGGLGGAALGTVQTAARTSFLIPYPHGIADEKQHAFAVSSSLAAFGQALRGANEKATGFGDVDTADMLIDISRGIGQQLWLVESHISRT